MAYLYLSLAFCFNAVANILLKVAATRGFSFGNALKGAWGTGEWTALVAAALFGLNLAAYLLALEKLPLSFSYPIMIGMTFVIITIATLYMGEKVTGLHIIGFVLILLGILAVVRAG